MGQMQPYFAVDRDGLAKILARRGIEFAVLELIQNGLDEDVKSVKVSLEGTEGLRGHYTLVVEDDSPEGFADLSHAYTLFAESKKKLDPLKRGRFNLGEKLVIAAARETTITTTKGTVHFGRDGRDHSRAKTESGTVVTVVMRMTHEDAIRTQRAVRSILVPPSVRVELNGMPVPSRSPVASFEVTLPTEIADEEGYLRATERKTVVNVFTVYPDETPTLFEMGIPVVALDCSWHVDVSQKIPLNSDRDNVTPAFARRIRAEVVNHMHASLTKEDATQAWVTDALESKLVTPEAVETVISQRYGDKRVVRDPSDPEGTKIAMSRGYAIIEPGAFSREAWSNIRSSGAALPAGRVTPSPKPFSDDPNADQLKIVPEEKWTSSMREMVLYSKALARKLIGVERLIVDIANDVTWPFAATFGRGGHLTFNVGRLGHAWFDKPDFETVNRLLIHEFSHSRVSDHLSSDFHEECCRLGAKIAKLALDDPDFFRRHGVR